MSHRSNTHASNTALLLVFFLSLYVPPASTADHVRNLSELALLPQYCYGTALIRNISNDPTPMAEYVSRYGKAYTHLHHFCWALNSENKASRITARNMRRWKLEGALKGIEYVVVRAPENFVFLPDIYLARGRILFKLQRDAEAVTALKKTLALNPDTPAAYDYLSRCYERIGDPTMAVSILEDGIRNTRSPNRLIDRLKELGITYEGPLEDRTEDIDTTTASPSIPQNQPLASKPHQQDLGVTAPPEPHTEQIAPPARTKSQISSGEDKDIQNPYCRFCPKK